MNLEMAAGGNSFIERSAAERYSLITSLLGYLVFQTKKSLFSSNFIR